MHSFNYTDITFICIGLSLFHLSHSRKDVLLAFLIYALLVGAKKDYDSVGIQFFGVL